MIYFELSIANKIIADVEPDRKERCGFLFGHQNSFNRTITKAMIAKNSKIGNQYTNFEISAEDYAKAEFIAEQENLSLIGVYHSHHNQAALPSEYDQEMALPCFSYIIVSMMNKKFETMRSWQLNNDFQFKEEEIEFIESSLN